MCSIEIGNKAYELPDSMDELTRSQYLFFIKLLLEANEGKLSLYDVKVFMLVKCLGIVGFNQIDKFPSEKRYSILDNFSLLMPLMDFLFQDNDKGIFPSTTTKTLVPWIQHRLTKYYGPDSTLSNISFQEYIVAHSHYLDFLKSEQKDINALNGLVAVLYRPQKLFYHLRKHFNSFDGQRRIAFNDNLVERRAAKLAAIPYHIKYAIFLWFQACELFFQTGSVTVEGQEINFSKLYSGGSDSSANDGIGLAGILFTLAETNVFGGVEATSKQNLFDIMLRLYQVKIEHEALQEKLK